MARKKGLTFVKSEGGGVVRFESCHFHNLDSVAEGSFTSIKASNCLAENVDTPFNLDRIDSLTATNNVFLGESREQLEHRNAEAAQRSGKPPEKRPRKYFSGWRPGD